MSTVLNRAFDLLTALLVASMALWAGLLGAHAFDPRVPALSFLAVFVLVVSGGGSLRWVLWAVQRADRA